jgi:hypothetical protein
LKNGQGGQDIAKPDASKSILLTEIAVSNQGCQPQMLAPLEFID